MIKGSDKVEKYDIYINDEYAGKAEIVHTEVLAKSDEADKKLDELNNLVDEVYGIERCEEERQIFENINSNIITAVIDCYAGKSVLMMANKQKQDLEMYEKAKIIDEFDLAGLKLTEEQKQALLSLNASIKEVIKAIEGDFTELAISMNKLAKEIGTETEKLKLKVEGKTIKPWEKKKFYQ